MLCLVILACVGAYAALFAWDAPRGREPVWGVSFSAPHARWLGLDADRAYAALLEDLGVRSLRLSAYWNSLEWPNDTWHFEELDRQMDVAARHGATVTLAVGRRLPRWPECHVPDWAQALPEQRQREEILSYLRTIVERYRGHSALRTWQVENEPLLSVFGECPPPDRSFLTREVALVRSLDSRHPILITDSGELSMWMRTSAMGDRLGTTMYRVVWNPLVGYWRYDRWLPAGFYRLKAFLAGVTSDRMVIAELQGEPWAPRGALLTMPLSEQRRSMDAARLRAHASFARRTGFGEALFWGAEYWYWLREHGDASLWEAARGIFHGA